MDFEQWWNENVKRNPMCKFSSVKSPTTIPTHLECRGR